MHLERPQFGDKHLFNKCQKSKAVCITAFKQAYRFDKKEIPPQSDNHRFVKTCEHPHLRFVV